MERLHIRMELLVHHMMVQLRIHMEQVRHKQEQVRHRLARIRTMVQVHHNHMVLVRHKLAQHIRCRSHCHIRRCSHRTTWLEGRLGLMSNHRMMELHRNRMVLVRHRLAHIRTMVQVRHNHMVQVRHMKVQVLHKLAHNRNLLHKPVHSSFSCKRRASSAGLNRSIACVVHSKDRRMVRSS